jgi:RNA-binding motif protein, X-linked 2
MNVIREIERINAKELENGIYGGSGKGSWHEKYKNSAWVYIGGLPYELTEGDIICVMSQWGEVEDINLVREKGTNKSQGFAFVKYEDQRSTILAVDNFNGIQILQRMIRVDHVDQYKLPKEVREREEEKLEANPDADVNIGPGHAYKEQVLVNEYSITSGVDHWGKPAKAASAQLAHPFVDVPLHDHAHKRDKADKKKKHKKDHKDSKKKYKKHKHSDDGDSTERKHHHKKKRKHHYHSEEEDGGEQLEPPAPTQTHTHTQDTAAAAGRAAGRGKTSVPPSSSFGE